MVKVVKIKVKERKLRDYYGYAYPGKNLVEINSKLRDNAYLSTLIHEILHILYPNDSENKVAVNSATLAHYILKKGKWRKTRKD